MRTYLQITTGLAICWTILSAGCVQPSDLSTPVQAVIAEVQAVFAPDQRVARFDVEAEVRRNTVVLRGETNLPNAKDRLLESLKPLALSVEDEITVLPEVSLGDRKWGIVNNSVANIRSAPSHAAELATQALLGTPLNVYKKDGGFYLVQTPDGYLGWIDGGGMERVDATRLVQFKTTDKIVYLKTFGFSFASPEAGASRVGDLVAGAMLEVLGESRNNYEIQYPDSRVAYIKKDDAMRYDQWVGSLDISGISLVDTAKDLMGLPYLWGGTSTKGADCSGFTKTVYFLNGVILPRDASQQVHTGVMVDEQRDFSRLEPGDLLFFGRIATDSTRERVVHVGMWIGNNEYIHSSGRVRINSIDPDASSYDEYNRNRYLRTKRILHQEAGIKSLRAGGLWAAITED